MPSATRTDGRLPNGVPWGDPSTAPRCTAHRRDGQPCGQPAVNGHRVCRMHGARGGAPKGPRNGNWRHGYRRKEVIALMHTATQAVRASRTLLIQLDAICRLRRREQRLAAAAKREEGRRKRLGIGSGGGI